jgi:signal transduction histidine kinase
VVQPEFDAMRPPGVTNHFGRIHIPNDPLRGDDDFTRLIETVRRELMAAVDRVMTCEPDHLVMGMSSETFWDGLDGSERLRERVEARAGVKVTMGSDAVRQALQCYGDIRRIAVLTPYMPVADMQVRRFFADCDFEIVRLEGLKCASPVLIAHVSETELRDAIGRLDGRRGDRPGRDQSRNGAARGPRGILARQAGDRDQYRDLSLGIAPQRRPRPGRWFRLALEPPLIKALSTEFWPTGTDKGAGTARMSSAFAARHSPMARRIERVSGIRPVTLLIAYGIALVIAILMATGIAANDLRRQTLARTEREEAGIASLLAAATDRWLNAVDAQLADIADHLAKTGSDPRDAATPPQMDALLRSKIGRLPGLAAIAILAPDGAVLARTGSWPAGNVATQVLAAADRQGGQTGGIGMPVTDPRSGIVGIPLVHRIAGTGAVVGLVAPKDFADLFAAAMLPADATTSLLAPDGTVLARYPASAGSHGGLASKGKLGALFRDTMATMIHAAAAQDGSWRIEALRALPHYSAAIVVSRNAMQALSGWARQGVWFTGFALLVAATIGTMVYLITRQFETHAALAAMRADNAIAAVNAEKIAADRARLAATADLLKAEAELLKKERLSVLGQLTATVAHELRNPLSAIRNTIFTLKELAAGTGIKFDRPVARIERSIERCDRIIADLLEYTRNRGINRTASRFDLWVEEVIAEQIIAPPVSLSLELAAGEAEVPIDRDRMRRVIINLVENAVHALAELPPDREKRITLRTHSVEGELVLSIADTGPGIAPETLERIFEPLFSTKSFGTGLGLPTVKQIVNQHGGSIAVDSTPGQGSCVSVRLPLAESVARGLKDAA